MQKFRQEDVPASPVNHLNQAFAEAPAIENHAVLEYDHPNLGKIKMPAYPVKMGSQGNLISTPAPELGQHSIEILKEILSYSAEKIYDLQGIGAIIDKGAN
jgi:crotonobetainyl-CoA:carnitine CoA-transferase CaiB-like acyl-CoA transferase